MFSLSGIYNTAFNPLSHLCILFNCKEAFLVFFLSYSSKLNFSCFLYFHLTDYNVLYSRSEDDLHSVKITHEEPVTKVDKVQ